MQCSKSLGYLAYPLLTFSLFAALSMQAQTTGNPPQSTPPAQSPAPDTETQPTPLQPAQPTPLTRDPLSQAQQQQGNSSSQPQTNYPNEQERVRLAREAQERVRQGFRVITYQSDVDIFCQSGRARRDALRGKLDLPERT